MVEWHSICAEVSKDDSVLDKIDHVLLHRSKGLFTSGAWCDGCVRRREEAQERWIRVRDGRYFHGFVQLVTTRGRMDGRG
jgi:hypothetical protein